MFIRAERNTILDIPSSLLVDGFIHLMAAYYVFNVEYSKPTRSCLFFFQDILMNKPDRVRKRPIRYSTFLVNSGIQE